MKSYSNDLPNLSQEELTKQSERTQKTIEQNEELKGQNEILANKLVDLVERSNKLRLIIIPGLALNLVMSLTILGYLVYGG